MGLNCNDENPRAMLVDPRDPVRGRGESTSIGVTAGALARHELTGQPYRLSGTNLADIPPGGSGAGTAAAAGAIRPASVE
jgi:hypothetical protein